MNNQKKCLSQQISFEDYHSKEPISLEKDRHPETYKHYIKEILPQRKGSSVKGKVVWLSEIEGIEIAEWPEKKEEVAYVLALALDDEENLSWYQKLARERRSDFLRNCLRITLKIFKGGTIRKTKAAYFTGVVKNRTAQQKRLEEYKKKHQKHTSLYGYDYKSYGK